MWVPTARMLCLRSYKYVGSDSLTLGLLSYEKTCEAESVNVVCALLWKLWLQWNNWIFVGETRKEEWFWLFNVCWHITHFLVQGLAGKGTFCGRSFVGESLRLCKEIVLILETNNVSHAPLPTPPAEKNLQVLVNMTEFNIWSENISHHNWINSKNGRTVEVVKMTQINDRKLRLSLLKKLLKLNKRWREGFQDIMKLYVIDEKKVML